MRTYILILYFLFYSISSFAKTTTDISIILIPDKTCLDTASEMNKNAAKITKNDDNPVSNFGIRIFEAAVETDNINEIYNEINLVKIPIFLVMMSEIYNSSNNFLSYKIVKNPKLQSTHELMLHILKQYKSEATDKIKDYYYRLDPDDRRLVDRYGNYKVLKNYDHHFPFFFNKNSEYDLENAETILSKTAPKDLLCKITHLAIAELSYHGDIIRLLKTKSL